MQAFGLSLINKVLRTIRYYGMIEEGDRVLVAVSGGPDSVALLLVLDKLKDRIGFDLAVCHFRHGVRSSDYRDLEFVKDLSERLGYRIFVGEGNARELAKTENISLEEACRKLRYDFFEEVAQREDFNRVALGHTLNDNVETFFMRVLRGASLSGLKGIPPVRDRYIRPFIEVTRDEVLAFLGELGVDYLIDETNLDERILRNWVRLRLIPLIKDRVSSIERIVGRTIRLIREDEELLSSMAEEVLKKLNIDTDERGIYFKIDEDFINLHPAIKRRLISKLLYRRFFRGESSELMDDKVSRIIEILGSTEGSKRMPISRGIVLRREYDRVFIGYDEGRDFERKEVLVMGEGVYHFGEWVFNVREVSYGDGDLLNAGKFVAIFSKRKVGFPLIIRTRREGDRITIKSNLTKKVKDFFIDRKIPFSERDRIPLLVTGEDRVIWIVGYVQNTELLPEEGEPAILVEVRRHEGVVG